MDALLEATDGCPACILAAFRATTKGSSWTGPDFDYKDVQKTFWGEHGRSDDDNCYY